VRAWWLLALGAVGCYGGMPPDTVPGLGASTAGTTTTAEAEASEAEADGSSTGMPQPEDDDDTPAADDEGTSTGAEASPDPWRLVAEETPCDYVLVHEQPGIVLEPVPDASELDVMPLAPGEGFYCMKVEFDLQTVDNLEALAAEHDGCPEYAAIASVHGSAATGEFIGSAFFHYYDEADCTRGPDTLEVGNFVSYTADTVGPWPPGERWHVVLEMRPWVSRVSLARDGVQIGTRVGAHLFSATVADTRDPVVRLGQARITSGRFFPWYGTTYENLQVHADVAPPPA
jgi:hypothetical protein